MTTDEIMALAEEYGHEVRETSRSRNVLRAAIESLAADAARYRWLIGNADEIKFKDHWLLRVSMNCLDASIDSMGLDKP
jgi:hypothetical protein